tara:strand:+ start:449 stop:694 length:246 start_codon:yes stop_codon:yes gene_type:complete
MKYEKGDLVFIRQRPGEQAARDAIKFTTTDASGSLGMITDIREVSHYPWKESKKPIAICTVLTVEGIEEVYEVHLNPVIKR